jgi:hypothetical protein
MRILNSDKLHYDADDMDPRLSRTQRALDGADYQLGLRPGGAGNAGVPLPPAESMSALPAIGPSERRGPGLNPADEIASHLDNAKSTFRRLRRLRALFAEMPELTAAEVAKTLGVARVTAGRYLETLCDEGVIRKVCPTASDRSHYYVRASERKL